MGKQNVVGPQVRKVRCARSWSQEELAAKCQLRGWDISRATLSKVEAGLRRVTDAEAFLLASVLGVELCELFPNEELVLQVVRNPESSAS